MLSELIIEILFLWLMQFDLLDDMFIEFFQVSPSRRYEDYYMLLLYLLAEAHMFDAAQKFSAIANVGNKKK